MTSGYSCSPCYQKNGRKAGLDNPGQHAKHSQVRQAVDWLWQLAFSRAAQQPLNNRVLEPGDHVIRASARFDENLQEPGNIWSQC